jgi:hypothetical protein
MNGLSRLLNIFNMDLITGRYARFKSELENNQSYLEYLKTITPRIVKTDANGLSTSELPHWVQEAEGLMRQAEKIAPSNPDLGWRLLKSAMRLQVFGLDLSQIHPQILLVLGETGKLTEWRSETVRNLFPKNYGKDYTLGELQNRLAMAMRIRDEHFDNEYYKLHTGQNNLKFVLRLFSMTVFALTLLYYLTTTYFGWPAFIGDWKMLVLVQFFGFLGAIFSVAIKLTDADEQGTKTVPDSMKDGENLRYRTLIGPGSAVIMYFFLKSGFLNPNLIQNNGTEVSANLILLSFLAGFSERLVIQLLERLSNKIDVQIPPTGSGPFHKSPDPVLVAGEKPGSTPPKGPANTVTEINDAFPEALPSPAVASTQPKTTILDIEEGTDKI